MTNPQSLPADVVACPRKNALETPKGRPFQKGNSGRPPGARNRVTVMLEKLMADDAEAVVQRVVTAAKGGDMAAARIILDRLVPPRKDRHISINLPPMTGAADAVSASSVIIGAVAKGNLTPSEGQVLAALVEVHRKALETEDLERRIAALEAKA